MAIQAILFDQDGVIIDTERDGHRVSFNLTFKEFGYNFEWGVEEYHALLQIAGGKERIKHYLHTKGFGVPIKPEEEEDLIKALHKRKTALFVELLASGKLPLRPRVKRFDARHRDDESVHGKRRSARRGHHRHLFGRSGRRKGQTETRRRWSCLRWRAPRQSDYQFFGG
jgi:phosphoglycolate phosphatase-like HAD superfamily hydrolase